MNTTGLKAMGSTDHELHQTEVKGTIDLTAGPGVGSSAAAEDQIGADGHTAEGMTDKEHLRGKDSVERKALKRLRETLHRAGCSNDSSGDEAFSVVGWEPISTPRRDGSSYDWTYVPPKVWADAKGVDDTCPLTLVAVKRIIAQHAKEGQCGLTLRKQLQQETLRANEHAAVQLDWNLKVAHLTEQLKERTAQADLLREQHTSAEEVWKLQAEGLQKQLEEQTKVSKRHKACADELQATVGQARPYVLEADSQLKKKTERADAQSERASNLQAQLQAAQADAHTARSHLLEQTERADAQNARANHLQAELEAAQAAAAAAAHAPAALPAAASDLAGLSDTRILLRAAGIVKKTPALKQALLNAMGL